MNRKVLKGAHSLMGVLLSGAIQVGKNILTHPEDYTIPLGFGVIGGIKGAWTGDTTTKEDNRSTMYGLNRTNAALKGAATGFINSLGLVAGVKGAMNLGVDFLKNDKGVQSLLKNSDRTIENRGLISSFMTGFRKAGYFTKGAQGLKDVYSSNNVASFGYSVTKLSKTTAGRDLVSNTLGSSQLGSTVASFAAEGSAVLASSLGLATKYTGQGLKMAGKLYKDKVLDPPMPAGYVAPTLGFAERMGHQAVPILSGGMLMGTLTAIPIGAAAITSVGAPDGHPFNVIHKARETRIQSQAQMDADLSERTRIQSPMSIGLNDISDNYYTNPALKPVRGRHFAGKYNDDGNLVFALSALRRG